MDKFPSFRRLQNGKRRHSGARTNHGVVEPVLLPELQNFALSNVAGIPCTFVIAAGEIGVLSRLGTFLSSYEYRA